MNSTSLGLEKERNLTADLRCIQCHVNDMTLDTPKISCLIPPIIQAQLSTTEKVHSKFSPSYVAANNPCVSSLEASPKTAADSLGPQLLPGHELREVERGDGAAAPPVSRSRRALPGFVLGGVDYLLVGSGPPTVQYLIRRRQPI